MKEQAGRFISWLAKNERHLGAILFVAGFIGDLATFTLLSVPLVNLAFIGYLVMATICTVGSHATSEWKEGSVFWKRAVAVMFPLGAQFTIGSLLSGCLIFYTKSSSVFVSWPFLILLVLVFLGNEYFRTYYKHLAFQLVLLFFSLYAYAIFALPYYLHQLGPWIFVASTLLSLAVFAILYRLLFRIKGPGAEVGFRYVAVGVGGITLLMNMFYFTELIPPIPLTLPIGEVYQSVVPLAGDYQVSGEAKVPWWTFAPRIVHHVPGTPLYVFSAVSAPTRFATSVTHVWEHYDESSQDWRVVSKISFPIVGGRDNGYRGYSEQFDPVAGKWRVSIETPGGQVIGRVAFTVVDVATAPALVQEVK